MEAHYIVEGSGAVGVAALRDGLLPELKGKKVLTFITDSNVDFKKLIKYHWLIRELPW
jgi:threonine dehydratase